MSSGFTYDLWSFVSENWEPLLKGLGRTLLVSAIAIVGAFVIGAVLGAARAHRVPVVSQIAAVYVEVDPEHADPRPDLLPLLRAAAADRAWPGVRLDAFTVAWLSVMIWGGAFNTENFRAGFEAVPHRFREAGLALGFSRLATFFNVTLPIGGRIALPSSINTYIAVAEEHRAALRDQLPGADHRRAAGSTRLTLETLETFTVLARRLPDARLVALLRHPPARGTSRTAGGALGEPARLGRARRALHVPRGPEGHASDRRDLGRREHGHRRSCSARCSRSASGRPAR